MLIWFPWYIQRCVIYINSRKKEKGRILKSNAIEDIKEYGTHFPVWPVRVKSHCIGSSEPIGTAAVSF